MVDNSDIWAKIISKDYTFIIAEAGVNHNGDINMAKHLIDAALEAKADAVKFQTFKANELATPYAPKAKYQIDQMNKTESQYEMLKKLELSYNYHSELIDYCKKSHILFMSTPFDYHSVNMLCELNLPVLKISSGEITNIPFLQHIAEKKRVIILSTGMSYLSEVDKAVRSIIKRGNKQLALMHCVSNYPARYQDINLNAISTLKNSFGLSVGYSDHSSGIEVPIAAVAKGASIIEKHFTLNRNLKGPDHKASLEPDDLKKMITAIRNIEKAFGNGVKCPSVDEIEIAKIVRKSIVAKCDIQSGAVIINDMLTCKRPGTGIEPEMIKWLIGKKINHSITKNTLLSWGMF